MRLAVALVAAALLAGCGRAVPAPAAAPAAARAQAAGIALTPEKAEAKAREAAAKWQADAALVGVVWAVPKSELVSVAFHVFRGDAGLLVVETRMTTLFGQKTHLVTDRKLTLPARALDAVQRWGVDGPGALAIAKAALPAGAKPVAMLALGKVKLAPPVWGVSADEAKLLIHAETGKVLLSGEGPALLLQVVEAARAAD